jgi:hypothetical protein
VRTSSSTCRTDNPWAAIRRARADRASSSDKLSRARACPAWIRPSASRRLNVGWKRQQPNGVGDVGPRIAQALGDGLLGHSELLEQFLEGGGELERPQVLPVDVLDQGLPKGLGVVGVPDHGGDGGEAGELRRPEPSFPRHQLVSTVPGPDHDGLQDPDLPDRTCQGGQRLLGELQAGLPPVRRDRAHRDLEQPSFLGRSGDQRRQPSSQAASFHSRPPSVVVTRSGRSIPPGRVRIVDRPAEQLGRELPVCGRALRSGVVDRDGLAVPGRLGQTNGARYDNVIYPGPKYSGPPPPPDQRASSGRRTWSLRCRSAAVQGSRSVGPGRTFFSS